MKKTKWKAYCLFAILICAGLWLGRFWGGVLFGFGISMLILSIIGATLVKRAARKIDKKVKDYIVENQN